eukprot:1187331-Pyramimonas_sp.AAC.3
MSGNPRSLGNLCGVVPSEVWYPGRIHSGREVGVDGKQDGAHLRGRRPGSPRRSLRCGYPPRCALSSPPPPLPPPVGCAPPPSSGASGTPRWTPAVDDIAHQHRAVSRRVPPRPGRSTTGHEALATQVAAGR